MAGQLKVTWKDVNGNTSSNSVWCADAGAAGTLLTALKACTNAVAVSATFSAQIDIGTPGTPVKGSNEPVRTKAAVTLSGNPASTGLPRPKITLEIPAPVDSLINGLSGDVTNALVTALLGSAKTNRGETLNQVDNVTYQK